LGEQVRQIVLHGSAMAPAAEMYLFMAARAELLAEVIEPALAQGRLVVLDRYHDSTLAYQGGGRGLDVGWPKSFRRPDRTYLLMIDPGAGLRRAGDRHLDRLEAEPPEFHQRVAASYERLAAAEPDRFVRLDGHLPAASVNKRIVADVRRLIATRRTVKSSS
jgi:dTMP kinase